MDRFSLIRAIERLRDGLFDPITITQLTAEEDRIKNIFYQGLSSLKRDGMSHLCICGSYGQGKSHTITYLNKLALTQGYATSVVQLDLREVPFHQFSSVYQSIMERLTLPDGKKFPIAWRNWADKNALELLDTMPHRFKMILTAMLYRDKQLTPKDGLLKKHRAHRPTEYESWLDRALMGYIIPIPHLKNICKYREVEGYRDHPLMCRGNDPYFQMLQSLGGILKEMGYNGLLLFFDEAESITQARLNYRVKSYHLLDQFFQTKGFVFPVFAFTDDFFDQVNRELYEDERAIFPKNYADVWQNLNILRLQDFSVHEWDSLLDRLMKIYSQAYQIDLLPKVKQDLHLVLNKFAAQETRFKLKALVNKLDMETQHAILDVCV